MATLKSERPVRFERFNNEIHYSQLDVLIKSKNLYFWYQLGQLNNIVV